MPRIIPSIDAEIMTGETVVTVRVIIRPTAAGVWGLEFDVVKLRIVERVLQLQLHTNPLCNAGTPSWWRIEGNQVGVTLVGVGAGTTITALLTAIGI